MSNLNPTYDWAQRGETSARSEWCWASMGSRTRTRANRGSGALLGVMFMAGAVVSQLSAEESSTWLLKTNATVTSSGVFLSDVVVAPSGVTLPHVRIAEAPRFGFTAKFEPAALNPLITKATQLEPGTNWAGAPQVVVNRRGRPLASGEVEQLLTERLTAEFLPGGGELELRLVRPWAEVSIPDEQFEMKFQQMPQPGLSQNFSLRLEIISGGEKFGSWQLSLRAQVWKDVWVASRPLNRGDALAPADFERARRDMLVTRNNVEADALEIKPDEWELKENLMAGAALNRWSIRRKPVVYRGQMADARVQHGSLSITLRVQVLEDAIPGQSVRIRNPQTKRELQGIVHHDQTILIQL